jgi:hypothetical protein
MTKIDDILMFCCVGGFFAGVSAALGVGCDRPTDESVIQPKERTPTMRLTAVVHHLMPFVAVVGGILILLMPRLPNYVVAIYLILVGVIGLNSLYHFVR